MIFEEKFETFINSLDDDLPDYLIELEEFGRSNDIPIIRHSSLQYLRTILKIIKPKKILELGSAIGFSALYMNYILDNNADIVTIEKDEKSYKIAKKNFEKYDTSKNINIVLDDGVDYLNTNTKKYDFIFLDFAKAQYIEVFEDMNRCLNTGGIIFSDNVLNDGDILNSKQIITHRNRTIHTKLRQYLNSLYKTKGLSTMTIPTKSGISITVKE